MSVCTTLAHAAIFGMSFQAAFCGPKTAVWICGVSAASFVGLILGNLYHYHIITTKPLQKPTNDPNLFSCSLQPGLHAVFGQKYKIEEGEYRVLFRSPKSPPNEWTYSHQDGPWVVLRNTKWTATTCAILPKHIQKVS